MPYGPFGLGKRPEFLSQTSGKRQLNLLYGKDKDSRNHNPYKIDNYSERIENI
jgi:hypothetical protein